MSPTLPRYEAVPSDNGVFTNGSKVDTYAELDEPVDENIGSSSSAPVPPSFEGEPVTYIFKPRFPMRGKEEKALGPLCLTKNDTALMVKRVFPRLAPYPNSRIEFAMYQRGEDEWVRIAEEAWPTVRKTFGNRIKVSIAASPAEFDLLHRRRAMRTAGIMFALLTSFLFIDIVTSLATRGPVKIVFLILFTMPVFVFFFLTLAFLRSAQEVGQEHLV